MVQAAIVLPLFMAVLLGSIRILLICYQGIRLQYEVSETTRMTFTLDKAARGGRGWEDFFASSLETRAKTNGLSGLGFQTSIDIGNGNNGSKKCDPKNIELSYVSSTGQTSTSWPAASAKPGETFSVTIKSQEPLLPSGLSRIASPTIELRAKAVAVIHRAQNE